MPSGKNTRGPQRRQKDTSKSSSERSSVADASERNLDTSPKASLELQQKCLDIFRNALSPSSEDAPILQRVKGHLYQRDFAAAFGKDEYLRVYASRWSPSRALCYLQIFNDLKSHLSEELGSSDQPVTLGMAILGGGAGGELVAAGAWLSQLKTSTKEEFSGSVNLKLVDIADWSAIVNMLEACIKTPPSLSKYASQARKDANAAMLQAENLKVEFQKADVLDLDDSAIAELVRGVKVIAFMFTLNELYSTSVAKTQQLLLRLKAHAAPQTLLLIVDSPGSYSLVSLNGAEKKYPMEWLLHHTMLGSPNDSAEEQRQQWLKVFSDSSKWFRLPDGLRYPIELEDMRFQSHLFTKSAMDESMSRG